MSHSGTGMVGMPPIARLTIVVRRSGVILSLSLLLSVCAFVGSSGAVGEPLNHNSDNTATGKYGTWGGSYTCSTCHTKAPSQNIKKVRTTIATPTGDRPVVFDRLTSTRNDVTGVFGNDERTQNRQSSRNVCEVCHHQTIYHNYSSSKLSNLAHSEHKSNRKDCMKCHSHRYGFRPPKAGGCTDCHGNPPVAPSELITNALWPSPPADGGAHGKHRLDVGMACSACHNNYGHGLLGNDMIEIGFLINRSTWPAFTGEVTTGTITATNAPEFDNDFRVAPGNPGTILLRQPNVMTCSIYCHGDGWAIPSGRSGATPVSWTNGPLGECSNAVCHGTTPANPPTPSVATGAHKKHVGTLQYACTTCHDDYPNPHMVNGSVKWNLSAVSSTATYKGFNSHSTATLATTGAYGSCAGVYCHSNVQSGASGTGPATSFGTVQWGGGLLNCDGCHGGLRSDAAPIATGVHAKHISTYAFVCADCHRSAGSDGPTLHGNRNIEVSMATRYGGAYDQTDNPPSNGFGSCSSTYCHSDGLGTTRTVSWSGSVGCTGCHGSDATSGTAVVSGKHTAHIDNARIGRDYGCVECHANTVNAAGAISSVANHVNTLKDYSGARGGKNRTACANAYCHSNGKGTPGTAVSWSTGPSLTNCIGCHGVDPSPAFTSIAGEPNYANAGAGLAKANSHEKHMGGVGGSTCIYCHGGTVNSSGTILANSALHTNGTIDVAPGGGKTFTWGAGKTCSSIICHGTGSVPAQWGEVFPADCTGCHGNTAASANPMNSGTHGAHMNNKTVLGSNFHCSVCHALTANSDDRSIFDTSVHGNGFKNYTGAFAGSRSSYSLVTGACSASYCHTDGKGRQNIPFDASNGWKSGAQLDCRGCHGNNSPADFASAAGEPNYASTGAGAGRSNSHRNHVDSGAASCVYCHGATVTGAGTIISDSTTHILNRTIDVVPGGGKSFSYGAGKTCSDISCHGGKGSFTQTWGAPVTSDCTGCHGNNAASSRPIASGSHGSHVNRAEAGSNFRCADCHAKTVNADDRTFAFPANHGNGLVNYSGARAGSESTYNRTLSSCSASYCHSFGTTASTPFRVMSTPRWGGTLPGNCTGCHGGAAVSARFRIMSTGKHQKHMRGTSYAAANTYYAFACSDCHTSTVTGNSTIADQAKHVNSQIDVAFPAAIGGSYPSTGHAPGADTTRTCQNIYCHSNAQVGGQQGTAIAYRNLTGSKTWFGTSGSLGCSGCHGYGSSADRLSGKHGVHVSTTINPSLGTGIACWECHMKTRLSSGWNDRNRHSNRFVDYSGPKAGGQGGINLTTGVCSTVYCHSDGKGTFKTMTSANWFAARTLDCTGCHGSDRVPAFLSVAGEPNYANTGSTPNSHKSHASAGAGTCVNCHGTTVVAAGTAIIANSTTHTDGVIDVAPGGGSGFTWDRALKSCSGISCHGGGTSTWGDASSAGCKVCHTSLSGAHNAHITDLFTSGVVTFYAYTANKSSGSVNRFGCANCHPTDLNKHRNGTVDVTLRKDKEGAGYLATLNGLVASDAAGYTKGGPTTFTCELSYCHSNGKSLSQSSGDYRTSPNWYGGPVAGNKCGMCHDNPPRYAGQSHYVAASYTSDDGLSPSTEAGHMVGIHFRNTYRGDGDNGFLGYSSSGDKAHGNTAYSTTIGCYLCHSGIVSSTQIDTYTMAGSGSRFACTNCHTSSTRTPLQPGLVTDTARHINGRKDVAFPTLTFKTKAQLSNVANALGWTRNGSYKAAGAFDSMNLGSSTWDSATKTCLTACHVNQPGISWGASLRCFSCHANQ